MNIVELLENIETVTTKNNDIIGKESNNLKAEYAIDSIEELKGALQKIEIEERLLQIGIIGRVKAGKSSLLNALLFNGNSVLPTAATPMSAALTILSYGEKLSAEVDFFSQNDLENIKNGYSQYKSELKDLTQKKLNELNELKKRKRGKINSKELTQKAERQATRELKLKISLTSTFEQYSKIKDSGIDYTSIGEKKILSTSTLNELSSTLLEYVGTNGKYMPFTKSVHIKIPEESLKNIQIVDTPGVNDPVQSREERTRELLKYCDVVFIVSPSGQFMSKEDIELMDRITAKEGVRELNVIASQVDLQLFGSIRDESEGDLIKAFQIVTTQLAEHLHSTLSTLKKDSPEIGKAYDQLIEESKERIIHSSGICQTIKENINNKESWDVGVKTAWSNLIEYYPDHFSNTDNEQSIASLDMLANISSVKNIIKIVEKKKDKILKEKKESFVKAKEKSLLNYKKELLKFIDEKIDFINNGDVKELKSKQKQLEHTKEKTSSILDEEYSELVTELEINIKTKLLNTLEKSFKETRKAVEDSEGSRTDSYTTGWWLWKKEHYYSITTVRTGAVKSALEDFTNYVESSIKIETTKFMLDWKKLLATQLIRTLRENIDDDNLETHRIKKVIRNIMNSVVFPDITYNSKLPDSLSGKGTLENSSADEFLNVAKEYMSTLRKKVSKDINSYLNSLITALRSLCLSDGFFSNYRDILKELENQIKNKAIMLDSFNRLKNDLEEINKSK